MPQELPHDAFADELQAWIDRHQPIAKHIEWGKYKHLGGPLPWRVDPDDDLPF